MSFAANKHLQRIIFAATSGTIRRGSGTITTATNDTAVVGSGTLFTVQAPSGARIYTIDYRFIGTVSSNVDNTNSTLTGNAAIAVTTAPYIIAIGTPTDYGFEVQNLSVGMLEKIRRWELVDESIQRYRISVRPTFRFSTPYLRRSATGSYDFAQVTEELANASRRVYVMLPDIGSDPVEIVSVTDLTTVGVERQFIKPAFDFEAVAKSPLSAIPSWYHYTKPKPGYL
jgi:hypothetical protein